MTPSFWVKSATFNNGTIIKFSSSDIIVLVGPNNSGKSMTLQNISSFLQSNRINGFPIVDSVEIGKSGDATEFLEWLNEHFTARGNNPTNFFRMGIQINSQQIENAWDSLVASTLDLRRALFIHAKTEERLVAANPKGSIHTPSRNADLPIQHLQIDPSLEKKLSDLFHKAFGYDLLLSRGGGQNILFHVGSKTEIEDKVNTSSTGYDEASQQFMDYQTEISQLPPLQSQGDGMRSFVGCMLYAHVLEYFVVLIDEPEAFLHPPQARLIGHTLAYDKPQNRQLFLATHSGDLLRGLLDAEQANVRVVRIRREGSINIARELKPEDVRELWKDPILRYSNILDGLFHEMVVLCESDGDCRFYAAILDAICENTPQIRRPDVMFIHCGGKDRIPTVAKALRALNVPLKVIGDFDILRKEEPLRGTFEILGGSWATVDQDWRIVNSSVNSKRPERQTQDVKAQIIGVLEEVETDVFPEDSTRKIRDITRKASAWSEAKKGGKSFVPNGEPRQKCENLLNQLKQQGMFVVSKGELENFCPSIGNHGPEWVNKVLVKDLFNDQELDDARKFVKEVVGISI